MLRAVTVALLVLALAGCGAKADREPFLDSRVPPDLAERFYPPQGWAWSLVQVGDAPAQRYGVASPPVTPRAHVLILVGQGESAEAWFETAQDLIARGITVWTLERAGQAGSGREGGPRDVIQVKTLDTDVVAVHAMVGLVIRPSPPQPLVILAHGEAAPVALRAMQTGVPADGLVLSSPRFSSGVGGRLEAFMVRAGLGGVAAPGREPWRRDRPDDLARGLTHDPWRGRVRRAWETANPDLRVSGVSLGWRAAFAEASGLARRDARKVRAPVLLLTPSDGQKAARDACFAMTACRHRKLAGARPSLHLESDPFRERWLNEVAAFVARRIAPTDAPLVETP